MWYQRSLAGLSFLALIMLAGCSGDSRVASVDRALKNLKGDVKSVEQRMYEAEVVSGEVRKGDAIDDSYRYLEFARSGTKVKEGFYAVSYILYVTSLDENQKKEKTVRYHSDSPESSRSMQFEILYTYDDQGCIIEEKTFEANGSLLRTERFETDDHCRVTQVLKSNPDTRTVRTYNADGFLIEEISYFSSTVADGTVIERDEDNNPIAIKAVDSSGDVYDYTGFDHMEFDDKENFILSVVEDRDGRPLRIVERTIEYY